MNSIDHFSLSDTLPGFNLGGASTAAKPEEKKDGASTATAPAAATVIFRLHCTQKSCSTPTIGAAASTAAPSVAVPPPSMLRGKTIEEIVNRWSSDLEVEVRQFNNFAGEVAVWDRALIENGNNVCVYYDLSLLVLYFPMLISLVQARDTLLARSCSRTRAK